jgi:hypothetical protein
MRGEHLSVVQHSLRIRQAAPAERAIRPKILVNDRYFSQFVTGALPILDPLTPRPRRLIRPRPGCALARHDREQFATLDARQDLPVEKVPQFGEGHPMDRRPWHV